MKSTLRPASTGAGLFPLRLSFTRIRCFAFRPAQKLSTPATWTTLTDFPVTWFGTYRVRSPASSG